MEIRFTASVLEAIQCILKLKQGCLWVLPKGSGAPTANVRPPVPSWCNFDLFSFSRIKATPVKMTERNARTAESCGHWWLSRKVEFYYCGTLVATVELVGMKIDGSKQLDNGAFWEVSKLGYFQKFDGGRDRPPTDWMEYEMEPTGGHRHPCTE